VIDKWVNGLTARPQVPVSIMVLRLFSGCEQLSDMGCGLPKYLPPPFEVLAENYAK
jgi:hypothetical protein